MFLRDRSRQAECFDDMGRPREDVLSDYAHLARVNRVFRHADPFTRVLLRQGREDRWSRLSVLEVGSGPGQLASELAAWARARGWHWEFTCLDQSEVGLSVNPVERKVVGDAVSLPFADGSHDLVIASQMTHHLSDDAVVAHLREAWRVARRGVIVSDLHRNLFLYTLVSVGTWVLGVPAGLRSDGRVSVERGFRCPEWRAMARAAGIDAARVEVQFGCRIVLSAFRAP